MADQNRWNPNRERTGRFGSEDRSRPEHEDYSRRDYGADDWRSGGEGYGAEGRSFDDEFSAGSGYREGAGRGREGGRQQRYGSQWGRGEGDYGAPGGAYGTEGGSQSYGSQNSGQGGYGIGAERDTQRYGTSQGHPSSQGYGAGGAQAWRGEDRSRADDRTWMERAGEKIGQLFGGEERERSHRGKGPKNYTRSDERIREDINDRLADDHWLDASEIEVQVASCEVTLTGTVTGRDDKRRAEDLVEQVSGVRHVQNNLRVQPQSGQSSFGTGGGSPLGSTTGATAGGAAAASAAIPGAATDANNGSSGRSGSGRSS